MNSLEKFIYTIPLFRFCAIIVSVITLLVLINYQIDNVYYTYIIEGEKPAVGYSSLILLLFYAYISFELTSIQFEIKVKIWPFVLFALIQPIIMLLVYCEWFNNYSKNVKDEMLKNSNIQIGYIYEIRQPLGKGTYHKKMYVRLDSKYSFVHKISDEIYYNNDINKGDTILLRVSDEYPRVTEVLKWNPTKQEIERYKTPRKFKSYINGNINEEEDCPNN